MKRLIYLATLCFAVLLGYFLSFGSDILQFSSGPVVAQSSFIQTLTAPNAGSFTQQNYNTGSGVVTTQANGSSPVTRITLLQHDPNNTNNIAALDQSKIAATFTLTEGLSLGPMLNNGVTALWLSDGGSPPNSILFGFQGSEGNVGSGVSTCLVAYPFSNFTTSGTPVFVAPGGFSGCNLGGPLAWLRVQETASARIYSVSSDGSTFAQVFTESNTAHFTTSRYGIATTAFGATSTAPDVIMTLYSFTATNP